MKLADKTVEVTSNIQYDESVAIGIEESAVAMVIERLISAYSNPYRAALREYTSNAYDEHIAAGVKEPIEVSLPSSLSPVLKVQDFGRGLTREELKGFGTIGVSTKRDSNEFTGGFGMGSKSALAAASQFTVVSVKNGKRNTVVVARDEHNVPHMNFLPESDADDAPTGTTVIVPISDVTKFGDLTDFWIGWKPGTILIDGEPPKRTVYEADKFRTLKGGLAYNDLSNKASSRDEVRILINQVYYELDYSNLGLSYKQQQVLKFHIVRIDNGTVDIAPSREELLYNARTKAALKDRFTKILNLASEAERASIVNHPNLQSALRARNGMISNGYDVVGLRWNGIPLVLPGENYAGNQVPDQRGTWANPFRDTNVRSGWKVEKNYRGLGHKELWRYKGDSSRFVIVHGAAPATTYGKRGRKAHKEAFGVAEWLSAQSDTRGYDWDFFITDIPLNRLNRAYRELADVIIHADDFNEVVAKVRSDRAKDAKADAAARRAAQKFRVVTSTYYGVPTIREYSLTELQNSFDHSVILRNATVGTSGRIREIMTTKTNYESSGASAVSHLISHYKVAAILVNKNDDLTDILPDLPKVTTFEELAVERVLETYQAVSIYERMALRDRNKYSLYNINDFKDEWIEKVKRKETAKWLKALRDYQDGGISIRNSMAWFSHRYPPVKDAIEGAVDKTTTLPESPFLRYPLLQSLNYNAKTADIVDYMNLRDKALKKG